MKTQTTLLVSSVLLLLACDSGSAADPAEAPEPVATTETEEQAVETAHAEAEEGTEAAAEDEHGERHDHELHEASGVGESELVEVAADGSRFDPAVEKSTIPAGNWVCDMGTVHYARPEEGDGTCPVCNMNLVQHN